VTEVTITTLTSFTPAQDVFTAVFSWENRVSDHTHKHVARRT
jgi:hypothetical protein